jgi:hypothetical protein
MAEAVVEREDEGEEGLRALAVKRMQYQYTHQR